jgi:hypothetical protein
MITLRRMGRIAECRKGTLLGLSFLPALALWVLGTGTVFAGKPSNTPVTVTFRSGPSAALDGVRGDGFSHDATIDGAGAINYAWPAGEVSYDLRSDNIYSAAGCYPGQITGTISGGGNLKIVADTAGGFPAIPVGTSQSGYATYNIAFGRTNYLLRFRAVDDLSVQPPADNCSTEVTITRTDSNTWVVEADSTDIARLLINGTKGPGFTNLGHYKATFQLTVKK